MCVSFVQKDLCFCQCSSDSCYINYVGQHPSDPCYTNFVHFYAILESFSFMLHLSCLFLRHNDGVCFRSMLHLFCLFLRHNDGVCLRSMLHLFCLFLRHNDGVPLFQIHATFIPFILFVSASILQIHATGIMDELNRRWFSHHYCPTAVTAPTSITLHFLQGALYFTAACLFLAALTLSAELLLVRWRRFKH